MCIRDRKEANGGDVDSMLDLGKLFYTGSRLYDANGFTRIAQYVLLGKGGARLFDELGIEPEIYHLNEAVGVVQAAGDVAAFLVVFLQVRGKEELSLIHI